MAIAYQSEADFAKTGTTDGNVPFNAPSGTSDGDLLVAGYTGNGSFVITFTDWTKIPGAEIASASLNNPRVQGFYRIWHTGDATSWTFVQNTFVAGGIVCARFSGVDTTTPFDVTTVNTFDAATGTSLALAGVTTATANAMLVSWFGVNSSSNVITCPASMTSIFEVGGKKGELAYEALGAAGATGTRTWTNASALARGGWVAALRPAASGVAVAAAQMTLSAAMVSPDAGLTALPSTATASAAMAAADAAITVPAPAMAATGAMLAANIANMGVTPTTMAGTADAKAATVGWTVPAQAMTGTAALAAAAVGTALSAVPMAGTLAATPPTLGWTVAPNQMLLVGSFLPPTVTYSGGNIPVPKTWRGSQYLVPDQMGEP